MHQQTGGPRQHNQVSTADLLGRPSEVTHRAEVRSLVEGKVALVTGGGGSIGRELVRQLTDLGASTVYALDHDEGALHALSLELSGNGLFDDDTAVLGDVRDRRSLRRTFAALKPDLVFHAAAHKHLPLLERFPCEGIKSNLLGTKNVVDAALACGATHIINVSTDKAARPSSVLGATKRAAELQVAFAATVGTRVASVRFGNVLGSRGSFLPALAHQVANGTSVTVTDPDVSRFFMSIPEAVSLVLEAAVMADRGETYVLDMGAPVRIVDLVRRYAELAGVAHPELVFTGLRPGEKLHEELFDEADGAVATSHPRITRSLGEGPNVRDWAGDVATLSTLIEMGNEPAALSALWSLLPEGAGVDSWFAAPHQLVAV